MTAGTDALKLAFDDYNTPGVPVSGAKEPDKAEVRAAADLIGQEISASASGRSVKANARVASTANVNIASALVNGATMDGVTLATGNRVLLKNQTAPAENGIYIVAASGAASRATDADTADEIVGAEIYVSSGTANGFKTFSLLTPAPIVLGTTALSFSATIDQAAVNAAAVAPQVAAAEAARDDAEAAALSASTEVTAAVERLPLDATLSAGVFMEGVNQSNQRIWAILDTGEARFPGSPILDSSFAYSRATPDGRLVEAIRHDGSLDVGPVNYRGAMSRAAFGIYSPGGGAVLEKTVHAVDIEAEDYDAWVNGGQVYFHVRGSTVQMTAGSLRTWIKAEVRGGQLAMVADTNERLAWPLSGRVPTASTALEYSDMYGQSVGAGNASGDPVSVAAMQNDRALMFNGGMRAFGNAMGHDQSRTFSQVVVSDATHDLVAAVEQAMSGAGETPNYGYLYGVLTGSALSSSVALAATCSAVGSANQEMLWKAATENTDPINTTGDPWRNLEARFWRAAVLARARGLTFVAGPLRHNQGEGNINRSKSNHLAGLVKFRDDWQALAQSANALRTSGGQVGKAPFIVTQTCSGAHYGYINSEVPWAQLQINLDDPTAALCCGPVYDQDYAADGVHLLSLGQEMQGARQAMAYNVWLAGNTWKPLHIRKDAGHEPVRVGNVITCEVWNPFNSTLVFDTTAITGLGADQGIQFTDDSGSATNTLTEIIDDTHIRLTLSGTPTGANKRIEVAMNGTSLGNSGPATGNRSTLRDSGNGQQTRTSRPVYNFICIDSIPVT